MKMKIAAVAAGLALSASAFAGPVMWIGDSSGKLGKVDVATGQVQVIGSMGQAMTDIAFDPQGNLYGINFGQLFRINKTNAQLTLVGNTGVGMNSLVFDYQGNLYGANNSLYRINTNTGAAQLIGNGGAQYASSGDLAFVGSQLYLSNVYGGDTLTRLDVNTGAGTNVGNIGFSAVYGLATNDNVHLYGMSNTTILNIDTLTGQGTALVNYGGQGLGAAWGTAFIGEAVPEPETYAMMLLGLGAVGLYAKRRKAA
ncbi:PEP-CTERM sorting domain-containing protein [Massilia sp. W12]|uniref:PEP-CTERM sorting domain-containing protein n=1 Tax=Massilia sp. W12 TaxID=3126507 RepID=UPI0030D03779